MLQCIRSIFKLHPKQQQQQKKEGIKSIRESNFNRNLRFIFIKIRNEFPMAD